uniref:Uncharacterized protein n=1 Tax=Helianthus annuus TaxID=4232 RepID=A0A251UIM7_HELAN
MNKNPNFLPHSLQGSRECLLTIMDMDDDLTKGSYQISDIKLSWHEGKACACIRMIYNQDQNVVIMLAENIVNLINPETGQIIKTDG